MAEKKYDVIHIGEVNMDITVPDVPEEFFKGDGDTYTCGLITDGVGGDAGNQSICVANLGDRNAFFGRLDCSFAGNRLAGILESQGVDTSLIIRSEDCRTPKIIVNVRKDGSHKFLCGKGGGYGLRFAVHCHTEGNGQTLSERTAGHVNAGNMNLYMAGEITVDLAECLQMLYREETSSCKSSVHNGRAVSL